MSDITIDNSEEHQMMVDMFVSNALELLDQIENDLMTLESQGANFDTGLVNKVFRAAHTIKGESGFINLKVVGKLAHSIEEVLDKMRDRELTPESNIISLLLHGFDDLRNLIQEIETSEEVDVSAMVQSLKEIYQKGSSNKVAKPPAAAPAPRQVVQVVQSAPKPVAAPVPMQVHTPAAVPQVSAPVSKKTKSEPAQVLVVDDDNLMCELMSHHLKKAGITVDVVMSAPEARNAMHKSFYRVVLCDINLGFESESNKSSCGIELISVLKQIYPLTQIIMLTGNVTAPNVLNSIEKGATDFISKRDSYERIVSTVKESLNRAERWSPLMLGSNN